MDTGAEVSVIPPSPAERQRKPRTVSLQAANNTPINNTYGTQSLTLNIGLRHHAF